MNLRALILALPLIACSGDAYGPPLVSKCEAKTITLTVVIHPDTLAVTRARRKLDPNSVPVEGFAGRGVGGDPDHHVLHVTAPRGRFDDHRFYIWGHELGHAFCGSWHPDGQQR
jgi:hypothetical protein